MDFRLVKISDDNYDEYHEALCVIFGVPFSAESEFMESLPYGYHPNQIENPNTGERTECFTSSKTMPNKGSDFQQAYQKGFHAVQFKNGFMALPFEVIL